MELKFNSHDKECFMSYKGIVNRGGYFSSGKQALYFDSSVKEGSYHVGPCKVWDDSIDINEGEYISIVEGYITGKVDRWGRKTRSYTIGFVFDRLGVVRMYRMKRRYNDSHGSSWANGDKTTLEFQREFDAHKVAKISNEISDINKERNDQKAKIENQEAGSKFVGKIGDRIKIKGTGRYVTSFTGKYGYSYLYIIVADGNTFKYLGSKDIGDGEKKFNISMVATIKKHEEYNGKKQTVINRPKALYHPK